MNDVHLSHGKRARLIPHCMMVAIVLLSVSAAAASAETEKGSLQEIYENARELARTPEGLEQAIARYQSVIKIHLANEQRYESALRQLAKCYTDSGRTEDGIRFFVRLVEEIRGSRRQDTAMEILHELGLKYPQLTEKVVAEMQLPSGRKPTVPEAVPSRELSGSIVQRKDKLLREKALEKVREMLSPESSDDEKRSGLATLCASLSARFDRDPFRPLVLPLLKSRDEQIRMLALRALPALGAASRDLPVIAPLAEDASPRVRTSVAIALIQVGNGEEKETVVPALMKLLQDEDPNIVEQSIRSMWGQYSSPEFDELLIELSRQPRYHHNTIYFCLSTMRTKSVAVCRRLIEELDDPDWNNSGRAAWGLTYGVTEEAKSVVEEGLLKSLPEEMNPYTRKQELQALRHVATEKSRPYLTSLADSDMETEEFRQRAREVLAAIDSKR